MSVNCKQKKVSEAEILGLKNHVSSFSLSFRVISELAENVKALLEQTVLNYENKKSKFFDFSKSNIKILKSREISQNAPFW